MPALDFAALGVDTDDETLLRLYATCLHEAGHTVAALHYGWRVLLATRVPSEGPHGWRNGHVTYHPAAGDPDEIRDQHAIVAIAGMLAVANMGFGMELATRGTGSDREYLESLGRDWFDQELWNSAMDVLRARWDDVVTLATRIVRCGTVYEPGPLPEAVAA